MHGRACLGLTFVRRVCVLGKSILQTMLAIWTPSLGPILADSAGWYLGYRAKRPVLWVEYHRVGDVHDESRRLWRWICWCLSGAGGMNMLMLVGCGWYFLRTILGVVVEADHLSELPSRCKNFRSGPTWHANCQMVRSGQPTGVLIPVI
jgi:hypothetical protein